MTAARAQGCKSRARIHPRFFCRTIDATHSGPRNSYVPGPSPKQLSPRSTHGRLLASASGDSSPCSPWLASGCTSDLTLWGPVAFCSHVPHRSRSLANRARRASAGRATPRLEALGGGSCHSWIRSQRPRLRGFDPRPAGMAIPNSAVSRPAADPVRTRPFHYHHCRRSRSWRDDCLRRLITHRRSSLRKDGGTRGG